uniref:Uncharacterized protein n=1 Tax=Oncorhynchus mykiss TaxID=8022 RepID=A0A8C7RRM6_ONCMY
MCCVGFSQNITHCIQDIKLISLPYFLQFYFSSIPQFFLGRPIKLARLALPQITSYYLYLLDNCIRHLVCLCEKSLCPLWRNKLFSNPLFSQYIKGGVAVYCIHGHGRTGTMLAKTRKISGTDEIRRVNNTVYHGLLYIMMHYFQNK